MEYQAVRTTVTVVACRPGSEGAVPINASYTLTSANMMHGPWLLLLMSLVSLQSRGEALPRGYLQEEAEPQEALPTSEPVANYVYRRRIPTPNTNYLQKKDVFMSRGWGAGGMPFSVLYMHPQQQQQQQQPQHPQQQQQPPRAEQLTAVDTAPSHHNPYKQITLRTASGSGAVLPSRRQYSIIPQLFVSYGWGPLGK